ncbi:cytochrome c [Burkholderiaceae bacterium FT117]|uniref:c-type cytochrome n=1 Tax=Zeimonas sediminis TaxID=2944268 RepID=UPI002342C597|nr:cytochrome c [Zeimonas sediminis]MCM5569404.1 cytochrome c [Zeimonas sediminis]
MTKGKVSAAIAAAMLCLSTGIHASDKPGEEKPPEFTKAFLEDPANIEMGKQVWQQQCRHCHGASAYPGKAPKLVPGRMDADFIYDRTTYGFRKMPAWKDVFSQQQRMAVAAYIKSHEFSP